MLKSIITWRAQDCSLPVFGYDQTSCEGRLHFRSCILVQHLYLFLQHLPIFTVDMGYMTFPCIQSYDSISQYRTAFPLLNECDSCTEWTEHRWQQKYRTLSTATLPSVLVLGQVGEGELLSGDENGASCDWNVWGLLSTVQFVCSLDTWTMNTSQCLFPFGNLYYPERDYPKCSLTINRKTFVKRLLDLTTEHWTALACHSNSQLLVCIQMCVSVNRGGMIPTAVRQAPRFLCKLRAHYLDTDTSEVNNCVTGPVEDQRTLKNYIFKSMSISGHRFPLQRSKNLLIYCNSFM